MPRWVRVCTYAKFLGFLGLLGSLTGDRRLSLLWLFFLLGFVEILYKPGVFWQSLQIVWSMIAVPARYGKRLPDASGYRSQVRYTLPFAGEWTVVNGGVTPKLSHSWSIPAQRYAYDFLILDERGQSYRRDPKDVCDYYCYGRDILSPADGVVVQAGCAQPDSPVTGKAECAADDIRGNYLLLRHAEREYSLLAHLQPGSLRVKAGDLVKRGQAVAACGNSGNTSEPHLHFQLQDRPSLCLSAGLPILFAHAMSGPAPHYAQYDPRPLPDEAAFPEYLRRGLRVMDPHC